MSAFGSYIRALRQERGILLMDAAKTCRICREYLSSIERGVNPPPSDSVIRALAALLKIKEEELFSLACKVPDGLQEALEDNPVLARLLYRLSQKQLPDVRNFGGVK